MLLHTTDLHLEMQTVNTSRRQSDGHSQVSNSELDGTSSSAAHASDDSLHSLSDPVNLQFQFSGNYPARTHPFPTSNASSLGGR